MSRPKTPDEFLAYYNPDGSHPVIEVDTSTKSGTSPFIVVRHGKYAVVINPLALEDHLSVDVHPFAGGTGAASAAAFGMTEGRRVQFPEDETPLRSHGWPAAGLVAVLVGEQGPEAG